jgi:transposase-like protein
LIGLATLHLKMGKYEQVESLALQALCIHEEHLGSLHPYVAGDLTILGSLYRKLGNYPDAEPLLLRALTINERALAPTHPQAAETLYEFARLRQAQSLDEEARSLFERALAARINTHGAAHPLTLETRWQLEALRSSRACPEKAAQVPISRDLLKDHLLVACPRCHQTTGVLKSGRNRAGSQRYRCRTCQLYFTPLPIHRQPNQGRKAAALALAEQGMSYRQIARHLGVHLQTVSAWISTPDESH